MTNCKKPSFYRAVAKGRSLVFAPNGFAASALRYKLGRDNVAPVLFVTSNTHLETALAKWQSPLFDDGVMLTSLPRMTHGVRLKADRVVWIGKQPIGMLAVAMFEQAMARADWYNKEKNQVERADRLAYEEHEVGLAA